MVFTTIFTEYYGEIDIKIIAEHQDEKVDFDSAEVYSIWNGADEPLGYFSRKKDELTYHGDDLTGEDLQQVSDFIEIYREGDWDL